MRELDRVLRELAETGRVGGAEHLIERLQRRLDGDPGQVISLGGTGIEMHESSVTGRRGRLIATASLAAVLAIALPLLLLRGGDGSPAATGVTTTLAKARFASMIRAFASSTSNPPDSVSSADRTRLGTIVVSDFFGFKIFLNLSKILFICYSENLF